MTRLTASPARPVRVEVGATPAAPGRLRAATGPWRQRLAVVAGALVLFAALAGYLRSQEAAVVRRTLVDEQIGEGGRTRALAGAVEAVRAMKLVTVEVDTAVTVEKSDESWRGDVRATVCVPVRLSYGVDLSILPDRAVSLSPSGRAVTIRVPRPARLSTELLNGETIDVSVGWARLRTRAGEYYLGQARRDLSDAARALVLSDEDAARVRRLTREQVEGLLRKFFGSSAVVRAVFDDDADVGPERDADAGGGAP